MRRTLERILVVFDILPFLVDFGKPVAGIQILRGLRIDLLRDLFRCVFKQRRSHWESVFGSVGGDLQELVFSAI